jgi:hypothetical protein
VITVSSIFEEPKITIQIKSCSASSGCSDTQLVFEQSSTNKAFINVSGTEIDSLLKITKEELTAITNLFTECLESYSDPVPNSILINCEFSSVYVIGGQELEISISDEYCTVMDAIFEILE